jgi:ATP-dependent DNA helicase PIF1
MRVLARGNDERLRAFDTFLLSLGNGAVDPVSGSTDFVPLPPEMCIEIDNSSDARTKQSCTDLIDWVFPRLADRYMDREWLAERAIFAPKNNAVDMINEVCMEMIPGEYETLGSADSVVHEEQAGLFAPEFLHTLRAPGMPAHDLRLKKGAILILLRNLNKRGGLCNGTRLIFEGMTGNFVMRCKIVSGEHAGNDVLIPRILTQPSEYRNQPCEWRRLQFPVRVAFGITINKGQGQSLQHAGVWLEEPVFTHGQLYVAASRVGHPDSIRFAIRPTEGMPPNATRNVVYHEVLS